MINLLQETKEVLAKHKYSEQDVLWIGSSSGEYAISWEEFEVIADFEYDNGFGGQEVKCILVAVLRDGSWLERDEYDGAEDWVHKKLPVISFEPKKFNRQWIVAWA